MHRGIPINVYAIICMFTVQFITISLICAVRTVMHKTNKTFFFIVSYRIGSHLIVGIFHLNMMSMIRKTGYKRVISIPSFIHSSIHSLIYICVARVFPNSISIINIYGSHFFPFLFFASNAKILTE